MTTYVDTHCHLDLFDDPVQTLQASPNTVVVAVSELPSRFRMLQARFRSDRRVRPALGLHPLRAATAGPLEEGQLIRLLGTSEYVGEIGLDFSQHGQGAEKAQLRVFERLLAEPALRRKVVSVHSRGAEQPTIERLEDARVQAILHWYSGPVGLIDRALASGLYFSINPSMLRSKKGQTIVRAVPRERVLTESDGPFAKSGRMAAAPRDMSHVIDGLAKLWGASHGDARMTVHANLARLYADTVGTAKLEKRPPTDVGKP